jgi:hypothetical protein
MRVLTYSYQMHVVFHTASLLHFRNFFVITMIFIVTMEAGTSVAQNKGHNLALNKNAASQNLLAMINPRDNNPAVELHDERER